MRSARYLLAMGLISTGAVFAYSGETMPLAFRMAQALQAAPASAYTGAFAGTCCCGSRGCAHGSGRDDAAEICSGPA